MKKKNEVNLSIKNVDMLKDFEKILSLHELSILRKELQKPVNPSIRLNPLKTTTQDLLIWCNKYDWELRSIPYCSTGYWLTKYSTQPGRTIEHKLGKFFIQDAASMLPVELFQIPENSHPLILDMAASPGGKTTHLCARSMDAGLILANDSSRERIQALKLILQTWGGINHAVTQLSGSLFGMVYPEKFDYVLLDAPCSMQGLRSTERHPIRVISKNEQEGLVRRQVELLESSLLTVKIGGQVVYSTCTLSPEENECVLNIILDRHGNDISIKDVSSKLNIPPALTQFNNQQFHSSISGAARIWPHIFSTAGFFAALITKDHRIKGRQKSDYLPPYQSRSTFIAPEQDAIKILNQKLSPFLSKSFYEIVAHTHTEIMMHGRFWFLVPAEVKYLFPDLPLQYIGMLIAEETPDGVLPSHEFLSRFSNLLTDRRINLSEEKVVQWMQGQDLPETLNVSGSPYIIITDEKGNFIGRGKCLQNRVRNLLPRFLL